MDKLAPQFFQFFSLVPTSPKYLSLDRFLTFFRYFLVYSWKLCAIILYAIIYTTNKYHWVCRSVLTLYKRTFIVFSQTPYLDTRSNLYHKMWVYVEVESCSNPNVNKFVSAWVRRLACGVKEPVLTHRAKRDKERVKEYAVHDVLY